MIRLQDIPRLAIVRTLDWAEIRDPLQITWAKPRSFSATLPAPEGKDRAQKTDLAALVDSPARLSLGRIGILAAFYFLGIAGWPCRCLIRFKALFGGEFPMVQIA
ncbi:MAG TPA: hypothetical protein DIW77_19235 [Chromatiaceae bacterium]|jgi:hypothetical protein|nr:MAG: hypothetical protein N838_27265 [Thiohalocapsa sp. PB-PSB1]HCS92102.1 hypothetical protein [Chromatiaceae bacterium]